MDIFVIMFGDILFEPFYYTDEEVISKRVEHLQEITEAEFWYKKLTMS